MEVSFFVFFFYADAMRVVDLIQMVCKPPACLLTLAGSYLGIMPIKSNQVTAAVQSGLAVLSWNNLGVFLLYYQTV